MTFRGSSRCVRPSAPPATRPLFFFCFLMASCGSVPASIQRDFLQRRRNEGDYRYICWDSLAYDAAASCDKAATHDHAPHNCHDEIAYHIAHDPLFADNDFTDPDWSCEGKSMEVAHGIAQAAERWGCCGPRGKSACERVIDSANTTAKILGTEEH